MTRTTEGGDRCPVCDAVAAPAASFEDYRLFACPACRCWSSDALARGAVASFETLNYFENADLDRPKWEALLARLEAEFEARGTPLDSALDVGCGTGAYLAFLERTRPGMRLEGIEIDPGRAAQARARSPRIVVHEGDAVAALESARGPYDLITLWDVFEHVPDPVGLLAGLARRLSPGGRIHIVTIHERSVVPLLGRFSSWVTGGRLQYPVRRTHDAHHVSFFTREGLEIAADRAGLAIRELSFDRLLRGRMDGPALLTAGTAALLWIENALGNGLFVELTLGAAAEPGVASGQASSPKISSTP